jgi:hypothetical protein
MTSMPAYEIYFRCDDCKREHTIHMKIHLSEGPDRKQSLAEFFAGRSMPPQVSSLQGHNAFCLKTGRRFKLDKDEQILLVPPSAISLPPRQPQLIPDRN